MKTLKDFRVIKIPLGCGIASHYMYIREHKSNQVENEKRTLFVGKELWYLLKISRVFDNFQMCTYNDLTGNIDYAKPRSSEEVDKIVRELFKPFGKIQSVSLSTSKE